MILKIVLFAIVGRTHAEVVLHIAAEIAGGGEVEHVGNLDECQPLVAQLTGNVERGITVDPEVGRVPADFLAYFREVFRRYAKFGCIICHLAVLTVNSAVEKSEKLVHNGSILWRNGVLSIVIGMEVEEVKNHELHGASDAFLIENKSGGIVAIFHT